MNTTILNKCIEELKKESPNISYILGMLETVVAMSGTGLLGLPEHLPTYRSPIAQQDKQNVQPIQKTEEELYRETMLNGRIAATTSEEIIQLG